MGLVTFGRGPAPGWQGRLLNDPEAVHLAFQPIVDLARGLATGYEALARVTLEPHETPDAWLRRAEEAGIRRQVESVLIARALDARVLLPPNCFLAVNVSPMALLEGGADPFAGWDDLRGVVVELTEDAPVDGYDDLARVLEGVRRRGAVVAIDDAGAGYAGLQHLLRLRPNLVKLDRALVTGVDRDSAKQALVRMVGGFVGEIDGWLLAEGIETPAELATLISLGVPLGQGYLLGRPTGTFAPLDPAMAEGIRTAAGRAAGAGLAPFLDTVPSVPAEPGIADLRAAARAGHDHVAAVDHRGRPLGLHPTDGSPPDVAAAGARMLTAQLTESPAALVLRALVRPPDQRLLPIVVCDFEGRYVGLAAVEDLARSVALESIPAGAA